MCFEGCALLDVVLRPFGAMTIDNKIKGGASDARARSPLNATRLTAAVDYNHLELQVAILQSNN